MLSHAPPPPSSCWKTCFGECVTNIVAPQLNGVANATFAIVVLTRTNAPRRQRRMREQLSLDKSWPRPTFVACDFERLPTGCPGPCFDSRSVAAHEPSTVAIALTHVAVSAVLRTFPSMRAALVLEDDVIARSDALHSLLQRVVYALTQNPGWHFVALGCSDYGNGGDAKPIQSGMQPCSRMYLVSRTGMEKMTNGLPLSDPIDIAMPKIFGLSNRNVYHASMWKMRHGSHVHRLRRGSDF
jgi:hypothetical protein